MDSEDSLKDTLYADLFALINIIQSEDRLFLLGDFNTREGNDTQVWLDVTGKHGLKGINSNGNLFLQLCISLDVVTCYLN